MKKAITILLIVVMLLGTTLFLAGCEENVIKDTISVAVLLPREIVKNSELSYVKDALEEIKGGALLRVSYIECKGDDSYKPSLAKAAKSYNMVIAYGWQFYEIETLCDNYPSTKFVWVNNRVSDIAKHQNLVTITFNTNAATFLAGYLAAKTTKTGTLGVIANFKSSENTTAANYFKKGAQYANPEIAVNVEYIKSYTDEDYAYQITELLISQGCDVIFQRTGEAELGVIKACSDHSVFVIGSEIDQKLRYKDYDKTILASVTKDIKSAVINTCKPYLTGELWDGGFDNSFDLNSGLVDLSYGAEGTKEVVSPQARIDTAAVRIDIEAGNISGIK